MCRAAVGTAAITARSRLSLERKAEFGGNHHLIALALQAAAEQLLVGVGAIGFRRVEERTAELDRAINRGRRFRVIGRAIGVAHSHAAKADGRDFQSSLAQLPFFQHVVFSRFDARAHEPRPMRSKVEAPPDGRQMPGATAMLTGLTPQLTESVRGPLSMAQGIVFHEPASVDFLPNSANRCETQVLPDGSSCLRR